MTRENLQDALGLIDDDMITAMDELRQRQGLSHCEVPSFEAAPAMRASHASAEGSFSSFRKKILRREFVKWGSLAACLCLMIGIASLSRMGASTDSAENVREPLYAEEQADMEIALEDEKLQNQSANGQAETKPAADQSSSQTTPETDSWAPPTLILCSGNLEFTATSGNYEWSWDNGDGTETTTIACGMHPLDCEDTIARFHTTQALAELLFSSAPDTPTELSVQCWSEEHWGDVSAESEPITVTDGQITLKEGGYIYEVTATWDRGTVHYAFYAYYEGGTP